MCGKGAIGTMLFMRCAGFERRDGNRTGANVQDKEEFPEQQYERQGTSTMSCVVLSVLVAVVGLIAVMAAWTGA